MDDSDNDVTFELVCELLSPKATEKSQLKLIDKFKPQWFANAFKELCDLHTSSIAL